ncbi:MAG: hypothetical protein R3E41_14340 [Burkholderiaceae bacterium]
MIGAAHPQRAVLEARCAARPRTTLHVQAANMAELIAAADVGIGAAGVATWERCALGLPALAFAVAANQQALWRDAAREGLLLGPAIDACDPSALAQQLRALVDNPALRAHLARRGLETVDALGAARVARVLLQPEVVVRAATEADARDLFEWRNAPEVRRFSRNDAPIAWDDHRRWLAATLADSRSACCWWEAPLGRWWASCATTWPGAKPKCRSISLPARPAAGWGGRVDVAER